MKTKRKKAPAWTPFEEAVLVDDPGENARRMRLRRDHVIFLNSRYQVNVRFFDVVRRFEGALHLSIKDREKTARHDWRDLQRIKNEIAGPEREAVELYPAESRLVDTSNQFHLWVSPTGETWPIGFKERLILEGSDLGVQQRPFTDPALRAEARENRERLGIDGATDPYYLLDTMKEDRR